MNSRRLRQSDSGQIANALFRAPKRISITLPDKAYRRLLDRSDQEGRSLSNLAAFLLESQLEYLANNRPGFNRSSS